MTVIEVVDESVNFDLLANLATRKHPLLNVADEGRYGLQIGNEFHHCNNGVGEIMQQARTAHHLLDMVDIPQGAGYSSDLDSRTWRAIRRIMDLQEQLSRIAAWHARETGPAGTVGDYCTECGTRWPCDTRRMADGTYMDEEEA